MCGGAKGAKGLWQGGVVNGSMQLLESRLRGDLVGSHGLLEGELQAQ